MAEPPTILSLTSSDVTLSWPSWHSTHVGSYSSDVIIACYAVEMLCNASSAATVDWLEVGRVSSDKHNSFANGPFIHTVGDLLVSSFYSFRVVIVWLNSNKLTSSPPGPQTDWILTPCGN